ncbi:protein ACCELERATED CELL DEATH 6-like [Hordeum vulgare subsp. vulgare]|uniref:PGG domain-containing protein n=1 Tax=Hordeum vulgare subsp. vulgare TaxID=112509 RepID=A0A8I6X8G5_HORVV|nr:protein ACCELERATED CELL DEATH 6-like [Hordeum vulgare subsp. vulgare]
MANIELQSVKPPIVILHEAFTNDGAYGNIRLVHPVGRPAANHVALFIPEVEADNAERFLEGMTLDGDRVLHIAARLEDVELVSAISVTERWRDAVHVTAKNKRGETALHCASATGNVAMIGALLTLLAQNSEMKMQLLRQQKDTRETCLHEAVRCGNGDAVRMLVQEDVAVVLGVGPNNGRALVKICDEQGVSPLYLATTLRHLEIVEFLTRLDWPQGYPAASYDGPGGKTALHAAVLLSKSYCTELSQHLAQWKNELIDKADKSGATPLHLLGSRTDKFIVELLLGLDPSAGYRADNEGSLPIHIAAANGSVAIVKLLSELRPNCCWSRNNLGQTILHIAVHKKKYNVVSYLCSIVSTRKFVGIFNTRDNEGNTALHLAVVQGNHSIFCRLMARREVSLSFTNNEERTPLDLAKLSIPPGISLFQGPRYWVLYGLLVAGADYCTCRSDHLATEPDEEKKSEVITKSAGLVVVCAALILNTSLTMPFSVSNLYRNPEKDIKRVVAYNIFIMSDALAFAFSAIAISCSTFAGLSSLEQRTRLSYRNAGALSLCAAALFIILVFMAGMYVAVGPLVHLKGNVIIALLYYITYPGILLLFAPYLGLAGSHMRALISRLGLRAWRKAVIRELQVRSFMVLPTIILSVAVIVAGMFYLAITSAKGTF